MNDEPQVVPVDGAEAQPESTQTTEAAVVAPQAETPALSLEQVERLLNEREQKLRGEFEQQSRRMQSKTDKAYADAMRKAKVIEDSADLLGLDADALQNAKQGLIDREFAAAFAEPQGALPDSGAPQGMSPTTPTGAYVTREELTNFVRAQGLDESAVDLTKYVGATRGDAQTEQDFLDDIAIARAKQVEAKRQQKIQKQQAQAAGQVKQEFGTLAAPAAGTPSAGYDPATELAKMNAQDPPTDPRAYTQWRARMDKLYTEAAKKEGWT